MEFPLWAAFGLFSATISAGVMLTQERMRVEGLALAFWVKVACATFALPLVLYLGMPSDPIFYVVLTAQAMMWVISDVIFYNTVAKAGAGSVSRILPASVVITFFLWFLIDPSTLDKYLATPWLSMGVVGALIASVYFAMRMRRCPVSWAAVRMIWFVIFAAVIGPLAQKIIMGKATFSQGPFAFVFFEALVMLAMWLGYYALRKPLPKEVMFGRHAAKGGFIIGVFSFLMIASGVAAIALVDNPGLVPAVKFTDTIIIFLIYRFIGRKEKSDVLAEMGIVACAVVIVVLKSFA